MKTALKVLLTLVVVAIAGVVLWNIWAYYQLDPRTRDGRVVANVVTLAPQVAGQVVEVAVRDNQVVRKGDVLFRLDNRRFKNAVATAQASVASARATLDQDKRAAERDDKLQGSGVSEETREEAVTTVQTALAALDSAKASLELAQIDLADSEVRSPVNGKVTNLTLRVGDYLAAGTSALAIVDTDSIHVSGYFEETKLSKIAVGAPVRITVMGVHGTLAGHVSGIAAAVTDPDNTTSTDMIADVDASFDWVRLAQRIPVRVDLDDPAAAAGLVAGQTASVEVLPHE